MPINPGFLCPITHKPMTDPVRASDNQTYERYAITHWLKTGNTSPVTYTILNSDLVPNDALKRLIDDYYQSNPTAEARYTVPSEDAAAASDEVTSNNSDNDSPALPTNNLSLFSPQAPSQPDLTEEEKKDSRTYFNPIFYG